LLQTVQEVKSSILLLVGLFVNIFFQKDAC
jgi:hypothetical protein